MEAETLPEVAQADLTAASAKGVPCGPKEPGMAALAEALNALSVGVHEEAAQGSCCCVDDTDLCDVLTDVDVSPGNSADHAAIDAATVWVTAVEDEGDDMVEAVPMDDEQEDVVMGKVLDSRVAGGSVSDSASERGGHESTRVGAIAEPPSYGQVSSYFGPLERFAESCKNEEAAHYLQKAKMSFVKAYASKTARQVDRVGNS